MKIEINEEVFKKIIDGVKNCVSTDAYQRPILQYIKISVSNDKITAYSCDSYRAAKTQIKSKLSFGCEFECLIKPIQFKVSKSKANPVTLEYDGENAFVEVVTEYGNLRYCFKQPKEKYIGIEKIYDAAKIHDRELGVNPNYAIQAFKALTAFTSRNDKTTVLETKENNCHAFIIRAGNEETNCEQLILPIRIGNGGE